MDYKKGVKGGKTLVHGFGMVLINDENKQFLFNQGQFNLFKNESKNPKVTAKQTSVDTKRTKKRSKSK